MLTKGWASGRLNFKYNTRLSRVRENFILEQIEHEAVCEVLAQRANAYAMLSVGVPDIRKLAIDALSTYEEYALPHIFKPSNLNTKSAPKDMTEWRAILDKAKAQAAAQTDQKKIS